MSTIHHSSQQPWKFDVMELQVGDRGFLKITFSSVTTWTVRGARGWDQMHPPPPLPVPPMAARTPYSPGLRGPCLSCHGAGDKLWEETTLALSLWPHWTSESEAQPAGSWTAARPRPSPHSRGQGSDLARAKKAPVADPPYSSHGVQAGGLRLSSQHPALPSRSGSTRGFGEASTFRPAVGQEKP